MEKLNSVKKKQAFDSMLSRIFPSFSFPGEPSEGETIQRKWITDVQIKAGNEWCECKTWWGKPGWKEMKVKATNWVYTHSRRQKF